MDTTTYGNGADLSNKLVFMPVFDDILARGMAWLL
jgi:hypothetical protein